MLPSSTQNSRVQSWGGKRCGWIFSPLSNIKGCMGIPKLPNCQNSTAYPRIFLNWIWYINLGRFYRVIVTRTAMTAHVQSFTLSVQFALLQIGLIYFILINCVCICLLQFNWFFFYAFKYSINCCFVFGFWLPSKHKVVKFWHIRSLCTYYSVHINCTHKNKSLYAESFYDLRSKNLCLFYALAYTGWLLEATKNYVFTILNHS